MYVDRYAGPIEPPRRLAMCLGVLASPISITIGLIIISWPFALGFAGLALPFCIVVGIPAAFSARRRIELTFINCMAVGGVAGFLAGIAIMFAAAICDWFYEIAAWFCILILGGVVCGGIAFPWIKWLDRRLPITGNS